MGSFSHFSVAFLLFVFLGYLQASLGGRVFIAGKVFCDQCSDGYLNKTDYALDGMEVAVSCIDSSGHGRIEGKNVTISSGSYEVWLDYRVKACVAYVANQNKSMGCGQSDSSAYKYAKYSNSTNGTDTYFVDVLFTYPWKSPLTCPSTRPRRRSPSPSTDQQYQVIHEDPAHENGPSTKPSKPKDLKILGVLITIAVIFFIVWILCQRFYPNPTPVPAPAPVPVLAPAPAPGEIQFFERHPHPTEAEIQQQLPTGLFSTFDKATLVHETCLICMVDSFQEEDIVSVIPSCRHAFHLSCLQTWMNIADTCPICRLRISV